MEFSSLFDESMLFFLLVSLALIPVLSAVLLAVSRNRTALRITVSVIVAVIQGEADLHQDELELAGIDVLLPR